MDKKIDKPPPIRNLSYQSPLPSPWPPPEQAALHQNDADEDDENVKQLGECSFLYSSLQDCLVNYNINWKSCQKALKKCNERRRKNTT